MPCNDSKRTMANFILEELALEFGDDGPLSVRLVFVPSDWGLEVHWVGQAVGADGAQIRQYKMTLIRFTNEAASFFLEVGLRLLTIPKAAEIDAELNPSLYDTNF